LRTKIWLRNANGVTKKRGPMRNQAIRFWYQPVPSRSANRSSKPFPIVVVVVVVVKTAESFHVDVLVVVGIVLLLFLRL
jgi:hypothetical protein